MKKIILFLLFFCSPAFGATGVLVPAGTWPLCEQGYTGVICDGFVKGFEGYFLEINTSNDQALAFLYTVTGTIVSSGVKVTQSGVIQRGTPYTVVLIYFGGPITESSLTVNDLGIIGPRI